MSGATKLSTAQLRKTVGAVYAMVTKNPAAAVATTKADADVTPLRISK